jgi:hypothetical protein
MTIRADRPADYTDGALLAEVRRVAELLGKQSVSRAECDEHGVISFNVVKKRFKTWNEALKLAELRVRKRSGIPNEEILAEVGRVWGVLGRRPTQLEFDKLSNVSSGSLKRRFGGILKAAAKYTAIASGDERLAEGHRETAESLAEIIRGKIPRNVRKQRYGNLINCRGMQHAPLNELGVVFVFGMLAKQLGFVVEAISAEYPDCEAKRYGKKAGAWEKVAIEVEYRSINFRNHGHGPSKCDLIVCWEHN